MAFIKQGYFLTVFETLRAFFELFKVQGHISIKIQSLGVFCII